MGNLLVQIFEIVSSHTGLEGRMKLASRTGVPRTKAQELEDTPELVEKFKKEASEILKADIETFLRGA